MVPGGADSARSSGAVVTCRAAECGCSKGSTGRLGATSLGKRVVMSTDRDRPPANLTKLSCRGTLNSEEVFRLMVRPSRGKRLLCLPPGGFQRNCSRSPVRPEARCLVRAEVPAEPKAMLKRRCAPRHAIRVLTMPILNPGTNKWRPTRLPDTYQLHELQRQRC
jgi:hypothetical protein